MALFSALLASLMIAESAVSKSVDCRIAYSQLAAKQAEYLLNPPAAPLRMLTSDDVTVTPMNGGKPFHHRYQNSQASFQPWETGFATGVEVAFKNSAGQTHKVQVIGKSTRPEAIRAVIEMLLKLPADTLEATRRIEVQSFVTGTRTAGYEFRRGFTLLEKGLTQKTLNHEFGHNLAVHVWGRNNPFKEWEQAFKADGSNFVSAYAENEFVRTKFAEDFAEAVESYLRDIDAFRKSSPNRAALLDTIFRDPDLWKPIRERNQTVVAQLSRTAAENPAAAAATVLVVVGGAGAAIVSLSPALSGGSP